LVQLYQLAMFTMDEELCSNFHDQASLNIGKLPRIRSRRDTPIPSMTIPYERPKIRKLSFADLWEETFPEETSSDVGSPTSDESSESVGLRRNRTGSITRPSAGVSRNSSGIETRRTSVVESEPRSPQLNVTVPKNGDARFGELRPSENWTRMRSRSRSGSNFSRAWRPRSLSTMSLPSVDDLKSTGWERVNSPTIIEQQQPQITRRVSIEQRPKINRRVTEPPRSASWTPRRLSGAYSRRFSDSVVSGAAQDIAKFKAATGQGCGDPTSPTSVCAQNRFVVEVTGDPSGVANGTYHFTEKNSRRPFFTRHSPRKATLAPRQSHGMWFLLCWGEEKNGKQTWTDYCSPHDGELPPQKGWRKCSRSKDKLKWNFGEEVPIRVEVLKDAYPTYT